MHRYKPAELDRGFDGSSLATATITIYPSLAAADGHTAMTGEAGA